MKGNHSDNIGSASDAIDEKTLRQLHKDIGGGLGEILDAVLDILPQQLAELEAAFQADDRQVLRRCAHRLKGGSSGTLGAYKFQQLCLQLEQMAEDGVADEVEQQLLAVKAEAQRVSEALRAPWISQIR